MHQLFTINGTEISGSWCCDLRILPDYRRMGVASRLEKLRMESLDVFSVSSSDISIKIKEKLGYSSKYVYTSYMLIKKLDPILLYNDLTRYLHVKRNSLLYNIGYKFQIHRLFSCILSNLFKIVQKIKSENSKRVKKKITITKINRFDDLASIFWNNIKNNFGLSAHRSSEYLNWKYVFQKNMNFQNYIFFIDNQIAGILIIRKTKNVGIISDVIVAPDRAWFDSIFRFAVSELFRQGSELIMCCGSNKQQNDIINCYGFIPFKHHIGVFHLTDRNKKFENLINNVPWLIGYGDHDIDEPGKIFQPSLMTLIQSIYLKPVRKNV